MWCRLFDPRPCTRRSWGSGACGCWPTGADRASPRSCSTRHGALAVTRAPHGIDMSQGVLCCGVCRPTKARGVFGTDDAGRAAAAGVLPRGRAAPGV